MVIGVDGNEANIKNRVGSGQYTLELLKQFAKDGSRRFEVFLKDKPLDDLPRETKNFSYKVIGPKKFWTQFALPISLTLKKNLDVFFSPAHYGPRFSRVPYVVTIHDLSYLHFPKLFKKNDLYQLTSWSAYSIKDSAHVLVPSQSTKDDILKNYEIKSSKITVTHEGYDKARFKPQPKAAVEKAKSKYKIKGDYIIFVGTIQPRKNIERLIEAFHILNTQYQISDTKLVVAGKRGWLYESILKKAQKLGIEKKVIFTDFVPNQDLPALISGAKLYINPSLWEGFGIPVIEAQACEVPVVAANTSSLPEILGESGVLVDPESPEEIAKGMAEVISSENKRINLVKKGTSNIKRFSWEKCALQTLKVLESAIR